MAMAQFPIPSPSFWTDPGPAPFRKLVRGLSRQQFEPGQGIDTWHDLWRRYNERLKRDQEDFIRWQKQQADYEMLIAEREAEGEHIAERLPIYLHKQKLSHIRTVQDRRFEGRFWDRVDYCEIEEWHFDTEAHCFKIDTRRLPYGLSISQFLHEDVKKSLSVNLDSHVDIVYNQVEDVYPGRGLWVIVEHRTSRGIIPSYIDYSQMIKIIPKEAPPLLFPVGVAANGVAKFADMDSICNVLVAGSKGAGKSNALNSILCTWIKRCHPSDLRLLLIDLKGGIEFSAFSGIPHLGGDIAVTVTGLADDTPVCLGQNLAKHPHEAIKILAYAEAEMKRRFGVLEGKAKKVTDWNKKYKEKMSRIVVVIDELASLMHDTTHKKDALRLLSSIARMGRAPAVYILAATQIPDKSVLNLQLSGNFDGRYVGRIPNGSASGVALGAGEYDASYLPKDIPGRMLWKWDDLIEVQAPYIGDMVVKNVIKSVKEGDIIDAQTAQDLEVAQELFEYALDELDGACPVRELFDHFRDTHPQHKIRNILYKWEASTNDNGEIGPVIELGETQYYLLPSSRIKRRGQSSRKLIDVDQVKNNPKDFVKYFGENWCQVSSDTKNGDGVIQYNGNLTHSQPIEEISQEKIEVA